MDSKSNNPEPDVTALTGGAQGIRAVGPRSIHPLVATAAIAVTAVCAITAFQFLSPRNARSAGNAGPAESSQVAGAPATAPGHGLAAAPEPAPVAAACADCGQVINVRTVRQEGTGTGLGAVAGGVLGGVLGHQMGAGRGKEAMTVVGAIGGVLAGNQVEKQARAQTQYLVDVRMADGSVRTVPVAAPPDLAPGAPVRVSGNTLVPR
jgi:outer membrane lipoprotein SlyB